MQIWQKSLPKEVIPQYQHAANTESRPKLESRGSDLSGKYMKLTRKKRKSESQEV